MPSHRGFTLRAIIVLAALAACAIAVLLVISRPQGATARRVYDADYLRDMISAFTSWANSNASIYPLPSRLDVNNSTVPELGRAKDTTANLYSMLIWNKSLSPDRLISDMEANPSIRPDTDYEYRDPKRAVTPADALWDPTFSADFTGGNTGNLSFSHLQPSGTLGFGTTNPSGRLMHWSDAAASVRPLFANRGPEIETLSADDRIKSKNSDSYTHAIYGSRRTWEGNVAFSDGSVEFRTKLNSRDLSFPSFYDSSTGRRQDILFFDEPDDVSQSNIYLGIFITAGEKPSEFKAIWD